MNNSTASTSTSCTYSYGDISSISRYILGTGFVVCSILATTGSIISLIILQKPSMRCKKSNKILSSLSTSDTLVGLGLCIVFTIQMLSEDLRSSCFLENTKNILAPWMIGTSSLNIALISYDRYVMLSSLTNYDIKMNKRRLYFLILSTWITPILFFMTVFINRLLFMAALALFTIIPLIIIIVAYCMVVKFVKKNSFVKERSEGGQSSKNENNRRLVQRLSVLVFCYFICLLPLMVNFFWEIFNRLSKQEKSVTHQTLTVVGALCACVNSVLNPIIYFSKFPDFQREFRKMFGLRGNAVIETNSTNNDTTSERVN
ncbi:protein trapped in endoderm-1-like [Clytia hemisphaerica]|uniref:protein trapped in endoderm-1-like n=1 Tax=Clytia hemisphaerica TaxID=252671 RepID=UPI0034D4E48F